VGEKNGQLVFLGRCCEPIYLNIGIKRIKVVVGRERGRQAVNFN
jgi:hypothetical protein